MNRPKTPEKPRRTSRNVVRRDYKRLHEKGLPISPQKLDESKEEVEETLGLSAKQEGGEDNPTYEQAVKRWDADDWGRAMDEEVNRFREMGTFEECELPKGKKALGLDGSW